MARLLGKIENIVLQMFRILRPGRISVRYVRSNVLQWYRTKRTSEIDTGLFWSPIYDDFVVYIFCVQISMVSGDSWNNVRLCGYVFQLCNVFPIASMLVFADVAGIPQ